MVALLIAFRGSKGQITGKGKIITGKLDFEDVYFVKELKQFNLFSVSQMCDKKNKVLFTDSECLVLSPDFKLPDENQVLLRVPRQNNMYSFNLENIVPTRGLACLIAKATVDESNKWHRRLGHVNFKNLNKLVKGNLVRGLPSKIFQNDHTCVACQKGKQHKASCKAKVVSSISQPLQLLHMDLFRPTSNSRIGTVLNYVGSKRDQEGEYSNPVTIENKANKTTGLKEANHSADTQDNIDAGNSKMEAEPAQEYFVLPLWSSYTSTVKSSKAKNGGEKPNGDTSSKTNEEPVFAQCTEDLLLRAGAARATSTNTVNIVSTPITTASPLEFSVMVRPSLPVQPTMTKCRFSKPSLMDIYAIYSNGIFTNASYDDEDPTLAVQTRSKVNKSSGAHAFIGPKKISQALEDENPEFPKKVTKSGYRRGTIDKTLFIKKDKNDIMLVQVYVDDIIFCSTKKSWCVNFGWHVGARKMDGAGTGIDDEKFPVSSMGELTFSFLGLQVQLQIPSLASNCFLFFGLVIVDGSLDTSKLNPNLAFGILECHHLTWKPILTVTILEQILIGNPQQEVVNFLAGDLSHV
ncbi:putative ribonuclease H-like domain-containing protein [Tanacetum coccineum]